MKFDIIISNNISNCEGQYNLHEMSFECICLSLGQMIFVEKLETLRSLVDEFDRNIKWKMFNDPLSSKT